MIKKMRRKKGVLKIRQIIKSKIAPATEEVPITTPIKILDSPLSTITNGATYDIRPSNTPQKSIMNESK